jgi:catechol 2,3-dioxygenase-like lactoylglutathione lyase family enzyme
MSQHLAHIALVVKNYDEAIAYYTQKLQFKVIEDTLMSPTKRWVLLAPKGSDKATFLLAQAANEEQESRIGNQTGGRVFLFLHNDDFENDYQYMKNQGVEFIRERVVETWGTVAVFKDLYGNLWDFIQPSKSVK